MYSTKKIITDINRSTDHLIEALSGFPADEINKKITENSWSAAQVVEHLIVLENLINKVLIGTTQPTSSRKPSEKIAVIKSTFLHFDKKLTAPPVIGPAGNIWVKEDLVKRLAKERQALAAIINSEDISLTCLDFIHRIFGELTRMEWAYFNIYHSERHLHQIENIRNKLKNVQQNDSGNSWA